MICNNTLDHDQSQIHPNQCISWTAIFIGAFIALGLGLLLGLLGIAVGLTSFKAANNGTVVLAVGGMLGIIVCIIIATFVSGFISGHLGRLYCSKHHFGIIYGLTTWVSSLILGALVLGVLSQNVTAYSSIARTVMVIPVPITQITTPVGSTKISSSTENGEQITVVEVNMTPADLASGAFWLFILFFVGALFSCFGASWGMGCCKMHKEKNK